MTLRKNRFLSRFLGKTGGLLWAALAVPLNQFSAQWHVPSYSNLRPNKVQFQKTGLKIEVNDSASPIFYVFNKPPTLKNLFAKGYVSNFSPLYRETSQNSPPDDVPFRLGLVETTNGDLSWFNRLFAPRWIKELLELFPEKTIKKITFLTLDPYRKVGDRRTHPKSDLIEDYVIQSLKTSGPFQMKYFPTEPITIQALWLQADGDDTHSQFSVTLESLTLETMN